MAKYEWSEIFISLEGEGPYTGFPTVYVRFARCNFTCQGFNNPNMEELTDEKLGIDPSKVEKLEDLPVIDKGCDSIYSWDERFSHLWHTGDEQQLAEQLLAETPNKRWVNPTTQIPVILSLTGGEPTLRAKTLSTLLNQPQLSDLQYVLIETNCSVPLKEEFIKELVEWADVDPNRKIIWSNSPKLSASGEPWEKAIRPDIANKQVSGLIGAYAEQYFKFVCGPRVRDFKEVQQAMDEYYTQHDIAVRRPRVYIMPEACTEEQQDDVSKQVADLCMDYEFIYCHRVQNSVFGNEIGT